MTHNQNIKVFYQSQRGWITCLRTFVEGQPSIMMIYEQIGERENYVTRTTEPSEGVDDTIQTALCRWENTKMGESLRDKAWLDWDVTRSLLVLDKVEGPAYPTGVE